MRLVVLSVLLVLASTASSRSANDEVYIKQESGRVSAPQKSLASPGNVGQPVTSQAGPMNPNTCDPKNSSSQACYAATLQGRGK